MLRCSNEEKNLDLQIYEKNLQTRIEKGEGAYATPTCSSSSTRSTADGTKPLEG